MEELAHIFIRFAEAECEGVSPLYARLARDIAAEPELLSIAAEAPFRQPIPNLFLGAVQFLLLNAPDEALATYYPAIAHRPCSHIPIEPFKTFVRAHQPAISEVLQHKIVQTNALNRTAYLMPIIADLFEKNTPISLVDIGASAGLNLNGDKYAFDYGPHGRIGESTVRIQTEIRSDYFPKMDRLPAIAAKIGIDQNPLDLKVEENARWLKALIWPDQVARFERLEAAIQIARTQAVELVQAQTIEAFEQIIEQTNPAHGLFVFHTHVIYQFTPAEREELRRMFDRIGQKRDLFYLAVEGIPEMKAKYQTSDTVIELTTYHNQTKSQKLLATTNGHADWIRWSV